MFITKIFVSAFKQGMVIFTHYWIYGSRRKSPFLLLFWLTPQRRPCCSPTGSSCAWSALRSRGSWMQVSLWDVCWCFRPSCREGSLLCSVLLCVQLRGCLYQSRPCSELLLCAAEWWWLLLLKQGRACTASVFSVCFKGNRCLLFGYYLHYNSSARIKVRNHQTPGTALLL